jgi:hypothetical protein
MKKIIVILMIFTLAQFVLGQGEVTKVGTTAANFLNLEIGARAVALAGAFTAVASDASALRWNPAGMVFVDKISITYDNINLYADMKHQFTGIVVPIGMSNAVGLSLDYINIGEIERTTLDDPDGFGLFFSNYNMAIGLSYARKLTNRITFGITGRWVREQIWQEKANGYCADIGVIFVPDISGLKLGMSITNFGPDMAMDQGPLKTFSYEPREDQPGVGNRNIDAAYLVESYPMPVSFQTGVAFDLAGTNSMLFANNANRITLVMEVNDGFDNSMRSKYGIEYEWNKILALRAGYKNNYDLAKYSFGGGLKIPIKGMSLRFDYAYSHYGDLGEVNVTSLEIGF